MQKSIASNAYDEVLYLGYPFPQTHPDRLATIATLFGLKPASVESCRVLELGCGDGGNLIPMAFGLPQSEFLGIDLAERPIAIGQAMVRTLGLQNVTFRPLDLMAISSSLGQFDYIIAHGLYSWVPTAVQERLLTICKANLAPNGVAYVSYNTYPGGHLRNLVREMMLFHVRDLIEPEQRVHQARQLVKLLAESPLEPDSYRTFLKKELERFKQHRDESLYHDHLAEINSPVYFFQFAQQATQHSLQYLGEADFFEMQDSILPPEISGELRMTSGDSTVVKEQYMDFIKCRKFRQTLLCHQGVSINRSVRPEQLTRFHIASSLEPVSPNPIIQSDRVEEFRNAHGMSISTNRPLAKAAILLLGKAWPQALHFSELMARSRSLLGLDSAPDAAAVDQEALLLGEILLKTYAAHLVELHIHPPRFALKAGERPLASPLARMQVQKRNFVTTLRHTSIQITDRLARRLLELLDGTRDRTALLTDLKTFLEFGTENQHPEDTEVSNPKAALENLAEGLELNLAKLARLALLVR